MVSAKLTPRSSTSSNEHMTRHYYSTMSYKYLELLIVSSDIGARVSLTKSTWDHYAPANCCSHPLIDKRSRRGSPIWLAETTDDFVLRKEQHGILLTASNEQRLADTGGINAMTCNLTGLYATWWLPSFLVSYSGIALRSLHAYM